jgi:hypothetical protein
MASLQTVGLVALCVFLLSPGVILSIPPGPNKRWIMGGQVTWANAAVHAVVISGLVFLFGQ